MDNDKPRLTITIELTGDAAANLQRRAAQHQMSPQTLVARYLKGYLAPEREDVLHFLESMEPRFLRWQERFPDVRFGETAQQPSQGSLQLLNEIGQKIIAVPSSLPDWTQNFVQNHTSRIAHDLDLLRPLLQPGKRILDVGAAPYLLSGGLKTLGHDVIGLDLDPKRHAMAIELLGLEVLACNIETEPWPLESDCFDIIVFNELFEHLRINPIHTMREALRVLAPGGHLTLSTPNLRSLEGLLAFLTEDRAMSGGGSIYEEYSKLEALGHMGHVREYTLTEVADFMHKVGFRLVQVTYRGRRVGLRRGSRRRPNWRPFVSLIFDFPIGPDITAHGV